VGVPPVTTHSDLLIRFLKNKVVDVNRRFDLSPYPVLTDTFSPVEYLTARVLRRALDESTGINGDEIRALADQQLRYGPRGVGVPGYRKEQDFLRAELEGLAQEVTLQNWTTLGSDGAAYESTNVIGRLYASESRRVIVATPSESAAGVAVLLELTRRLINSPVPPRVGVDMVFFDGPGGRARLRDFYGTTMPISTVVLDMVCGKDDSVGECSAERLEVVAESVLNSLNTIQISGTIVD
jgi:hypothetical protein